MNLPVPTPIDIMMLGIIGFTMACMIKYRNLDIGNSIRKIPKKNPRIEMEEIFGL